MPYNELNMKIGNKKTGLKRTLPIGVLPVNLKTIINLPLPNLFLEKDINIALREVCKELLNDAMTREDGYRHGEIGYLLRVNNDSTIDILYKAYGDYIHIPLSNMTDYWEVINSNRDFDPELLFVHNHPNNDGFSFGDFSMIVNTFEIRTIIAVGNRGNFYFMRKNEKSLRYRGILTNIEHEAAKLHGIEADVDTVRTCRDQVFNKYLYSNLIYGVDYWSIIK